MLSTPEGATISAPAARDASLAFCMKDKAVAKGDNMTIMVKIVATEDAPQTFLPNNFRILELDIKITLQNTILFVAS